LIINTDDTPKKYLADLSYVSYGLNPPALYNVTNIKSRGLDGQQATFVLGEAGEIQLTTHILGEQGLKIALAAAAVAHHLGLKLDDIKKSLNGLTSFSGRMQILDGVNHSTIIDDTYNASPHAVRSALDVLYGLKAPQKIAILGNMNELGDHSKSAHQEIGEYCRPKQIDLVITLGPHANKYLASAAGKMGCKVVQFDNPYAVGECYFS
jgi:UDP-N-acetylmuramoyl-tripeptide--D-alanyl-D-alanine ligase